MIDHKRLVTRRHAPFNLLIFYRPTTKIGAIDETRASPNLDNGIIKRRMEGGGGEDRATDNSAFYRKTIDYRSYSENAENVLQLYLAVPIINFQQLQSGMRARTFVPFSWTGSSRRLFSSFRPPSAIPSSTMAEIMPRTLQERE